MIRVSIPVEAWYRERYLSKVTYKYKHSGFLLKPYVMPPAEMDGKTLYFPVASGGQASETKRGDRVKLMNAGKELVPVTAKFYEAAEMVYKFDINKTSASEMETNARNAADALGQKHDSVIMGAFQANAGNYTLASTGAAGSIDTTSATNWTPADAIKAVRELRRKTQNPRETAICVLPISVFDHMLTYTHFANSQYVGDTPLAQGVTARTWHGCHWIQGYDEMFTVTGSGAAAVADFYVWFPRAIGSGDTGGIKTDINYIANERGWLHDNTIEIGAKLLLADAVVQCKAKINIDPTLH
jgi:hypothetical protein